MGLAVEEMVATERPWGPRGRILVWKKNVVATSRVMPRLLHKANTRLIDAMVRKQSCGTRLLECACRELNRLKCMKFQTLARGVKLTFEYLHFGEHWDLGYFNLSESSRVRKESTPIEMDTVRIHEFPESALTAYLTTGER